MKLFDCTLRDGANVVGNGFSPELTESMVKNLLRCGIQDIELGNAKGIGSCWIGFAQDFMDRPEIKARYKVPEQCRFVSALSLGYAKGHLPEAQRKEPVIFNG